MTAVNTAGIASTTPTRVPVTADGTVAVLADDSAGIFSNVKLTASSITTNDGGMHTYGQAADLLIDADYWTTDGGATLEFGDRVRIGEFDYGQPDFTAENVGTQVQDVTAVDNPSTLENEATVVTLAADLKAWLQLIALDGPQARCAIKALRHQILTVPADLTRHARRHQLAFPEHWPWVAQITRAFTRIQAYTPG